MNTITRLVRSQVNNGRGVEESNRMQLERANGFKNQLIDLIVSRYQDKISTCLYLIPKLEKKKDFQ